DLVAHLRDATDKLREPLRHPAEREERRRHLRFVEEREEAVGVGADAALEIGPLRARHDAVEDADVEVVLHVDGHRIDDDLCLMVSAHIHRYAPLARRTVFTVERMMNRSSAIDRFLM